MTKLIGLPGSLRRGSFNTALLRTATKLMPNGVELTVHTVRGIPLYDADLEAAEGIPQVVTGLKAGIVASDGLLLATPEYNNSIPGVFKNAIDWLTRPGRRAFLRGGGHLHHNAGTAWRSPVVGGSGR